MGYSPHDPQPSSSDSTRSRIRRRRPPSQAEQVRRKAWGREWGAANRDAAKQLREEGK